MTELGDTRCIWCGGNQFTTLVDNENYTFLVRLSESENRWFSHPLHIGCCQSCGITTQLTLPDSATLSAIYSKYYSSYPSFAPDTDVDERMFDFLSFLGKNNVPLAGSALEIGSYDGKFLNLLQQQGLSVFGCDPNTAATQYAKERFGIQTKLEHFSHGLFLPHSFDLVVARLILEHVSNPGDFLVALNKVTKPDGYIAIEIPQCQDLMEGGSIFWMVEHVSYFTPSSLRRAIYSAGFDTIVIDSSRSGFIRAVGRKVHEVDQLTFQGDSSITLDVELAKTFYEKFSIFLSSTETYLNTARENNLPIAVYGIGNFFTNLISITSLTPEEIVAIFDSNPGKWGMSVPGVKTSVHSPDNLSSSEIGLVIVATQGYEGVLVRLKRYFQVGGVALVFRPQPYMIRGLYEAEKLLHESQYKEDFIRKIKE